MALHCVARGWAERRGALGACRHRRRCRQRSSIRMPAIPSEAPPKDAMGAREDVGGRWQLVFEGPRKAT